MHTASASRTSPPALPWLTGLILFLGFVVLHAVTAWPEFPEPLRLQISFPAGETGRTEPILTAGVHGNGDLLVVKYEGPDRLRFSYDEWAVGGPASEVIRYEPGRRYALELELPALREIKGASTRKRAPIRIVFDGREILHAEVGFHRRDAGAIHFGINGIAGFGDPEFRGHLSLDSGRPLRGGPAAYFSRWERATSLFHNPAALAVALVLSVAGGFACGVLRSRRQRRRDDSTEARQRRSVRRWAAVTGLLCVVAFAHVSTAETFRLIYPEEFSDFYDFQAQSLLRGKLDVPPEALGGEAFVFAGKSYGYFGPTPALLRIPFVAFNLGFGQLSRSFMLVEFALSLAAVYAILVQAVRVRFGPNAIPSRWSAVVFVLSTGLGSTLFFVSSRAYIYHEAILCGTLFALWSTYFALRYLETPATRWWVTAVIAGTLSVHARPPVGLYALVLVGVVAAVHLVRAYLGRRHAPDASASPGRPALGSPLLAGLLAVVGVLSFNGLSYLKFRTIEGCPLRYNLLYTPERLAKIEGRQFHADNLRYGLDSYFLKRTLRIDARFPYFGTRGRDPHDYPEAKIDMNEQTTGIPWAMPHLCWLALIGLGAALWRDPANRTQVLVIWVAAIPTAVAMFMAIAVSHRYTADFLPFLIAAAAMGLAALNTSRNWVARAGRYGLVLLMVTAIPVTVALTLTYQGERVWGVPEQTKQRYLEMQKRVDHWLGFGE